MKGLCSTLIFTSGSGSFLPVTNMNSEGNIEQTVKIIIVARLKLTALKLPRKAFYKATFKIDTAQERQLRGRQLVHSAMDATVLPYLPAPHTNWMELSTSPAHETKYLMSLATCRVDPENKRLRSLNASDVNGGAFFSIRAV